MLNKAFSQLTDEEKARKFDIAIRNHTNNVLTAERVRALEKSVSPSIQYMIAVHPFNCESFKALVKGNILHIYIPAHLYINERK